MAKIKQFDEFINEDIIRFEDFETKTPKKEKVDVKDTDLEDPEVKLISGDEDITVELSPEEEQDMADGEDDEDDNLEEAVDPLAVSSKDIMRIQDIIRKSEGNVYKARKLAETMCKLITDKWKALRRARAAEREGQPELADIFMNRAKDLGALGA